MTTRTRVMKIRVIWTSTRIRIMRRRRGWRMRSRRRCWPGPGRRARLGARAAREAARCGQTAVLAAVAAEVSGRRGPGLPGSVQLLPGEGLSPAAGFGSGQPLDVAPPGAVLGSFLEGRPGTTTGTGALTPARLYGG
jgi:hypothetical protein